MMWFFLKWKRKEEKKKIKRKKKLELTKQLAEFKCGGQILALHFPCLSLFFFLFFFWLSLPPSSFLLPLTLFTLIFILIFLLHLTISSKKKKKKLFLTSQPSFTHLPQYFFRSLCSWALLPHTHFWWNPFSNPSFLCTNMSSSSNGSCFLTFHGKKYDPTFDWNDEEGLLQNPKTYASYSHMDIKVSFSLVSLLRKMLFHASLKVWWWDIIILLYDCWNLGHCMIDHVVMLALEHFLKCCIFGWTMLMAYGILGNVGNLWCCRMNFVLDFGGHWHC